MVVVSSKVVKRSSIEKKKKKTHSLHTSCASTKYTLLRSPGFEFEKIQKKKLELIMSSLIAMLQDDISMSLKVNTHTHSHRFACHGTHLHTHRRRR